ncbi:MAG: hypothetical protein LDLANPLL_01540 [Turneriella sp.]|nr:hypothetical protein [Turneriella sp.]
MQTHMPRRVRFFYGFTIIALALFLVQCKSAPKKVEPPPPPPPPVVEEVVPPEPELKASHTERPVPAVSEIYEEVMEVAVRPTLNLRTKPSTRGRIVKRIPYGEAITILDRFDDDDSVGTSNKWYRVRYRGKVGYVNSRYLRGEGEDIVIYEKRSKAKYRRSKMRKTHKAKRQPKRVEVEESSYDGYNKDAEPSAH